MIVVLAANDTQATRWRQIAGLNPRNIAVISVNEPMGGRGRRLESRDVVMLPGVEEHRNFPRLREALIPSGVDFSKVSRVPEGVFHR